MVRDSLPAFEGYLSLLDGDDPAGRASSSSAQEHWRSRWCTLLDGCLHVYENQQAAAHRPYDTLRTIALTPFQQLKVTGDYDGDGHETWDLTLVGCEDTQGNVSTQTPSPYFPPSSSTSFHAARTIPRSATNGSLSAMFTRLGNSTSSRSDESKEVFAQSIRSPADEVHSVETGTQSHLAHTATWGRLAARSKRFRQLVTSGMPRSSSNLSELRTQTTDRESAAPTPSSLSSSYGESSASTSPPPHSQTFSQRPRQHRHMLSLRAPDSTSMVRWAEALSTCLKSNDQANRPAMFAPVRTQAHSSPAEAPSHARSRRPMLARVSSDAFYCTTATESDDGDPAFSVVQAGITSRRRRQASHSNGMDVQPAVTLPLIEPMQRKASLSSIRREFRSHRRASIELFSKLSNALTSSNGGSSSNNSSNNNDDSAAETMSTADRRASAISVSSSTTARLDISTCDGGMSLAQADTHDGAPSQQDATPQQRRPSFGSGRLFSSSSIASSSSYVHSATSHDTTVLTSPITSSTPFSSSVASSSPYSPPFYLDGSSSPDFEQTRSKETQLGPSTSMAPLLVVTKALRGNDDVAPSTGGPTGLGLDLGGGAIVKDNRRRMPQTLMMTQGRPMKLFNNSNSSTACDYAASAHDSSEEAIAVPMARRASLIGGQEYATIIESPSLEDNRITTTLPAEGQEVHKDGNPAMDSSHSPTMPSQPSNGMAARLLANPRYTSARRLVSSPSMPSLKADPRCDTSREERLQQDMGKGSANSAVSPRSKLQGARQMLMATARRRITSIAATKGSECESSVDEGRGNADANIGTLSPQLLRYDATPPIAHTDDGHDSLRFTTPPMVERILPPEEIIATIDRLRNERVDQVKETTERKKTPASPAPVACSPSWTFATSSTTTKLHRSRTSPALNAEAAECSLSPVLSAAGSTTPRMNISSPTGNGRDASSSSAAGPMMRTARSLPVPPRSGRKARPRGNVDTTVDDRSALLSLSPPDYLQMSISPQAPPAVDKSATSGRGVLLSSRRPSAAIATECKASTLTRDEQLSVKRPSTLEIPDSVKGEAIDDKENMVHSASFSVRSLQAVRLYASSSRRGSTATTTSMSTSTSASAISYSRRGSAIQALPTSATHVGVRGRRRSNTTATSSLADSKDRRKSISESYSFAIALAAASEARKASALPASRSTLMVDY